MTKKKIRLIIISLCAAVVLILVFQNWHSVQLEFLFWSMRIPGAILVPLLVAMGFLIGYFVRFRKH